MTEVEEAVVTSHGLPIIYRPGDPLHEDASNSVGGRKPKASEVTAELIVKGIVENGYRAGDRLPPETEMIERVGVSRETLREALRILEAQGVLSIRRGPGGGPFINSLNASYLARTSALYFHLAGSTYAELFETWASIEPIMSQRVASQPDRRWKRERLGPFLRDDHHEHTRDEILSDLHDFHAIIATMSGNRVLTLIVQSINHIVVHQVLQRVDPTEKNVSMVHSHHEIARAIVDGFATKARNLMEQHIREVVEWAGERHPEMMQEFIAWR